MKKLIAIAVAAIATLAGYKQTISNLKAENERLSKRLEDEDIDDEERESKLAEFEAQEAEANAKADELAAALAEEPSVPTVDPATFEVTEPATQNAAEAELSQRAAESAGQS